MLLRQTPTRTSRRRRWIWAGGILIVSIVIGLVVGWTSGTGAGVQAATGTISALVALVAVCAVSGRGDGPDGQAVDDDGHV
jgi:hypothetical protein